MQEQDLKQIRKVVREEIKENNKEICQKIEDVKDEIITSTKQGFDENTKQHREIYKEIRETNKKLDKKASASRVLSWGNGQIGPVKTDVDKLKYIHRQEWKNLPDSGEVSRALAGEGT